VPHRGEEEEDEEAERRYYDDYNTAKNIRESARTGSGQAEEESQTNQGANRVSATSRWGIDPYAYLDDEQQVARLPEQKGSAPGPLEELGTNVPDISDRSTDVMASEIEDLGDMGALDFPDMSTTQKPGKMAGRPREQEARPRPRTGQMQPQGRHSPRAPRPGMQDFDDDEDLLDLAQRPTSASSQRPSRGLANTGQRPSQKLSPGARARPSQTLQPGARPSQKLQPAARPSQTLQPGTVPQPMRMRPASAPVAQRSPNRQLMPISNVPPRQQPGSRRNARRSNRALTIILSLVALLLIVALLLFYLLPTATVTISLQAQTFSQTVQLNATADPQANVPNKVLAQTLQRDFSATGQGTASGSTRVGSARAEGKVTFTNNGTSNVVIPTGTIITTQSGVQFTTEAEVAVPHNGFYPGVPISAQQAGDIGMVPANSITLIPATSINAIAQYNHTTAASINLTVTNAAETKGGGAIKVPAVTAGDLQDLARTLHQKLQQEVNAWLSEQMHTGDLRGALVPDVLNSNGPLPEEQLGGAPAVGQPASSGAFPGTLSLHIHVLVARAHDLQTAAGAQLNAAALRLHPVSMLATQLPVTLTNSHSTPSKDGNSLAITAKASGGIVRQISAQDISGSLTGKGVGQVASDLKTSLASAGIQDVQVSVSPSFLSFMPLRADHIQVILRPVQQIPSRNMPNG
jgi:hypothetical protein